MKLQAKVREAFRAADVFEKVGAAKHLRDYREYMRMVRFLQGIGFPWGMQMKPSHSTASGQSESKCKHPHSCKWCRFLRVLTLRSKLGSQSVVSMVALTFFEPILPASRQCLVPSPSTWLLSSSSRIFPAPLLVFSAHKHRLTFVGPLFIVEQVSALHVLSRCFLVVSPFTLH